MSKIPKKGNNSKKNFFLQISPNTSLIIPFQLTQVSSFYLKYFLRNGIYKISFRFFQRAVILQGDSKKKIKKIHVCYFSMRNPYMKFQDDISLQNIIVAKFQGPKFLKRAITQKISYEFFHFLLNILIIIPYQHNKF